MNFKDIIILPFAKIMVWLCELTGSYGASVVLFALVVNILLSYFMGKSKKSTMRTTRLQPEIDELKARHGGNQQKLNEETQKLYRENNINPMSGCLWSLIPFPILIALYSVIRQPLSKMMGLAAETVTKLRDFAVANGWYEIPAKTDAYMEIKLANIAHQHWAEVTEHLGEAGANLMNINMNFIGCNLGDVPWEKLKLAFTGAEFQLSYIVLFLIPLVSALLSWAGMKISTMGNPPASDERAEASMKSMNLMMPLMSIWICFVMPAAMGIYWIANSIIGMGRDYVMTRIFKRQLDAEDAEKIAARSEKEKELELKRLDTERLREEGRTTQNTGTSKKKLQASERQKQEERKAALARAERAEKRKRRGIDEPEMPASQIGNRRYALGRAYVPDRYTNPETAEEKTIAAAESENAEAIDTSVESDVIVPAVEAENTEAIDTSIESDDIVHADESELAPLETESAPEADEAGEGINE